MILLEHKINYCDLHSATLASRSIAKKIQESFTFSNNVLNFLVLIIFSTFMFQYSVVMMFSIGLLLY